jgi:hypothetical protein
MKKRRGEADAVAKLETGFRKVEERVSALREENAALKERVRALEGELAEARRAAQDSGRFHGEKLRMREKIEKIMKELETIDYANKGN